MEQKQLDSEVNRKASTVTGTDTASDNKKTYEQFIPTIASLKELDLTGIEPLLPPIHKRYYTNK
ncbi:hypothetical protein JNUCC31_31680 [Paenibacillus sp. JNUCC31]|jgi:hypothetical protein|uniref:hypothetical protein n=1 Tax=Paenibacillus TaxID=44249 RepID=UPI00177FB588|nr:MULTISPECIES: hypothetical protein [Paenibacillus]MEC0245476.1 hypothetical protein [Paenibacillus chitinolyticus]QOS79165.1 hypothetical protein JNUCC31_31680 [Paenibacillus sp. JNUCC-31]